VPKASSILFTTKGTKKNKLILAIQKRQTTFEV
jgi:hypothetical protein